MLRLRRKAWSLLAAVMAVSGLAVVVPAGTASAWPYNCSSYVSGGSAYGRCTTGTGYYRTRATCTPYTSTSSVEYKWGPWIQVRRSIYDHAYDSVARCDSSHPRARSASVFGTN